MNRCRACDARIVQPSVGRPRQWCHQCRPAGSAPPNGVLSAVLRARREQERAANAARSAAYRRVARTHPDELAVVLAEERGARGLDVRVRCPYCGALVNPAAGMCVRCGHLVGAVEPVEGVGDGSRFAGGVGMSARVPTPPTSRSVSEPRGATTRDKTMRVRGSLPPGPPRQASPGLGGDAPREAS